MRNDMFKVIVERPRHGSRYADVEMQRTRWRDGHGDEGEAAARESLKARHRWHKSLNENLNPLRRWLASQVGRPWANVHAELCAGIDRRSTVQQHIHQHIGDFVAVSVVRIDGALHYVAHWRQPQPLEHRWAPVLYVDPDSGLLRENRAGRRARRDERQAWADRRRALPEDRRDLSPTTQLHRIDGIWYEVALAPLRGAPDAGHPAFDALRHVPVRIAGRHAAPGSAGGDPSLYGRDDVYAWKRRQLSAKELRHHGVASS